jgi:outer membrane protein assembly factor BamB
MSDPIVRGDEVLVGSGYGNLGGHWEAAALGVADGTARTLPFQALVDGLRDTTAATLSYAFGSGTPVLTTIGLRDVATGEGWSGALSFSFNGGFAGTDATVAPDGMWQSGAGTLDTAPTTTPTNGYGVRFFTEARPADCAPAGGTYPYFPCPQWATPVDGVPTEVVVTDSSLVVGTATGTVYALDPADGTVQWSRAVGGPVEGAPAFADGLLYVVTTGGALTVLDGATGEPVWGASGLGAVSVQPALAGGVVYVGSGDGTVRAFAAAGCGAATCAPLWQDDTGDAAITGAPAVTNGRLLVGTADGRVVAWTAPAAP